MAKKTSVPETSQSLFNPDLFLWLAAILVLTFISFSPLFKNGFINWDDNGYVFENPYLAKPLPEAIRYFFGPHYFVGNYIPLTMTTFALEYHAFGLKPGSFHTINLLFHLANVLLVFWFIYLLSGKKTPVAGLVALFFAIHPMHVESVAWIAELKDVQYSFFFLAGLIAYFKHIQLHLNTSQQKPGIKYLALTLLFFCLSVLSKPAAIIFPLIMLAMDYYKHRAFTLRSLLEKIPFVVIALIFTIVTFTAQAADQLLHDDYSVTQRIFFASHSFLFYLLKLFLPLKQAIFYPYPDLSEGKLPYLFYLAPFLLLALCFFVYRSLKQNRLIFFGFLFFAINLILVLQLVTVGDAIMADRYTYLPYLGIFFIGAMLFDRFYQQKKQNNPSFRLLAIAAIVVLVLSCSYFTHARCQVWKNDMTVATDLLNKFPDDRLALNNKGYILFEQKQYYDAIPLFEKAISRKPDYLRPYVNLINTYISVQDLNSAMTVADSALRHIPNDINLFYKKGNICYMQGRFDEAILYYKKASAVKKEDPSAYIFMAEVYYTMKDYDKGIEAINKGLHYEPTNHFLLNNKGYFLFLKKQYPEAAEYFKATLKQKPDYSVAVVNLADCNNAMEAQKASQK